MEWKISKGFMESGVWTFKEIHTSYEKQIINHTYNKRYFRNEVISCKVANNPMKQ